MTNNRTKLKKCTPNLSETVGIGPKYRVDRYNICLTRIAKSQLSSLLCGLRCRLFESFYDVREGIYRKIIPFGPKQYVNDIMNGTISKFMNPVTRY